MRLRYKTRIIGVSLVNPVAKELLIFSLPLLGTVALQMLIVWTDTLMLGGIKGAFEAGQYSTAHPLAIFICAPLMTSSGLIFH